MVADPVATRYAQAFFEAAKAEDRLPQTLEQLALLGGLITDVPDLRQFMLNPDVDPDGKIAVLDRSLKGTWSELVRAFVRMVVSWGRTASLPAIADALQALADADAGRVRVVVRSARPLSDAVLARLRHGLESRERRHVTLEPEVVPELLGGITVQIGHRIIDASVARQLDELRERLTSVKVT